jgi:glycerol-3-phosphate dehydrogenase (NAD(P)+)
MTKIAILGGGSWGTGLSVVHNSRGSHDIALWVREPAIAESIKTARENANYLRGRHPCLRRANHWRC